MACESGCVTSVDIMIPDSVFGRCLRIKQYNGDRIYLPTFQLSVPPITSTFENRKYEQPKVDAQAVRAEMDACFKDTDAITLNCGACGYDTCYAKSAAVVRGEATRDMCISYLKAKAESFANSVVNTSPAASSCSTRLHHPADESVHRENVRPIPHGSLGNPPRDYFDVRYMRKTVEKGEIVRNLKIAFKTSASGPSRPSSRSTARATSPSSSTSPTAKSSASSSTPSSASSSSTPTRSSTTRCAPPRRSPTDSVKPPQQQRSPCSNSSRNSSGRRS